MFFGAWRVNGSLSVSRAIGDAEHKPYISGEPDTEELDLEGIVTYHTRHLFEILAKGGGPIGRGS